jgi:hypothetical protein
LLHPEIFIFLLHVITTKDARFREADSLDADEVHSASDKLKYMFEKFNSANFSPAIESPIVALFSNAGHFNVHAGTKMKLQ